MGYNQIVAFLTSENCPDFETFEKELQESAPDATFEHEEHPWDPNSRGYFLRWDKWWINLFYEVHDQVILKAQKVAEECKDESFDKEEISKATKQIRMYAKEEAEPDHLNEYINIMDFLERIPGAVMYNRDKKELYKSQGQNKRSGTDEQSSQLTLDVKIIKNNELRRTKR